MNKQRNQFVALSEQDRKYILNLCSQHSYDDTVEILHRPRSEGGLGIATSRSALSRFFTTSSSESAIAVLAQYAAATHVRHDQDGNAFLGAIRASVQARVLENLKNGKALADLDKDVRLLKTTETLYLIDAKWRAANPKAARAAYQAHVDRCANLPDVDFFLVEELGHSDSTPPVELSDFQQDVIKARHQQQLEAEKRKELLAKLKECGIGPDHLPDELKKIASPSDQNVPLDGAKSQPILTNTPKTPVIPHFPPNPTSPHSMPESPKREAAENPPVPTPVVRLKVGRNQPCPCGSGKKYKKCCLNSSKPAPPTC